MADGAKGAVMVAIATGAAGIIVGIATQTGLGFKFTNIVTSLSQGNMDCRCSCNGSLFGVGMGLPTVAAFIMVAALAAPALMEIGISPLAAQMFVFYYCCISTITPPVALSAYAGASIAGSDPFKTGFTAVRLGLVAFIVPFMFLNSGELVARWYSIKCIVIYGYCNHRDYNIRMWSPRMVGNKMQCIRKNTAFSSSFINIEARAYN